MLNTTARGAGGAEPRCVPVPGDGGVVLPPLRARAGGAPELRGQVGEKGPVSASPPASCMRCRPPRPPPAGGTAALAAVLVQRASPHSPAGLLRQDRVPWVPRLPPDVRGPATQRQGGRRPAAPLPERRVWAWRSSSKPLSLRPAPREELAGRVRALWRRTIRACAIVAVLPLSPQGTFAWSCSCA